MIADGPIECFKLGVARDIPAELTQLQEHKVALQQSNRVLKGILLLLGIGLGIYVVSKIIHDERKAKEKRTGRA